MEFETRDFFEASFLYAKINILPKIHLDVTAKFCWFIFPEAEKCENLISEYYNRQALIDPKGYADATRSLKDLIFRSGINHKGGRR